MSPSSLQRCPFGADSLLHGASLPKVFKLADLGGRGNEALLLPLARGAGTFSQLHISFLFLSQFTPLVGLYKVSLESAQDKPEVAK